MSDALQPVFPIQDLNNHPGPIGLTLRDYFATAALANKATQMLMPADVARNAYRVADAMMEARK
jgi:hypothetical protein